jgi:hypothetical protein
MLTALSLGANDVVGFLAAGRLTGGTGGFAFAFATAGRAVPFAAGGGGGGGTVRTAGGGA